MRTIPSLYEILQGKVEISRIQDIEIEDLLGREPVKLDVDHLKQFVGDRTVLVTGAGGSIGSSLPGRWPSLDPQICFWLRGQNLLSSILSNELKKAWPNLNIAPLVADVGDEGRMRQILQEFHVQVVVHAAAHKHVGWCLEQLQPLSKEKS